MKKILIGICGIGNGHINRQRQIIDKLLDYNVEIVIAITENCYNYFNDLYPTIKKIVVHVPWIFCDNQGIDFVKTQKKYLSDNIDYYKTFLDFAVKIKEAFNGDNPDIVFTDYEPNVAQFSYAIDKPLICLDQHSKFLILPSNEIDGFSINIERSRLLYFFPKAHKRYVSSFYEIKSNNDFNIQLLPPIIKNIPKKSVIKNKVLVYFSTYSNSSKYYSKILDLIKNYPLYEFYIYTNLKFPKYKKYKHLKFKEISSDFDIDLSDCNCIISSSGHQLISEAISLGIPLYIFPLDTFDQNYCCHIVNNNEWGKKMIACDKAEFEDFLKNIEKYRKNMLSYVNAHWKTNWEEILFNSLETDFGLEKLYY